MILGEWQTEFLGPLNNINPDMRLLIATSASEVDFNPNDPSVNTYIQEIPSEWFLTQVGTTLREDVDSTQKSISVSAVKIGDIDLFVAGDTAIIDGESVYVENVDSETLTLTVRRGYVRPASAHTAGTRIAAHISFWPNSWILNLSTLSPKGVAISSTEPEWWSDYNARLGAKLLSDPRWSGLFVDSAGLNESWLIGNSTARSIDPDQSDRLITDYSDFDDAWNEGLSTYLFKLRGEVGPERIIYLNGGIPEYSYVNGRDFEGFPYNQDPYVWHTKMFGPYPSGSYFDWMSTSRQPNLTTLETYEDDSHPDPNDTDGYPNNCNDPDFTPNYRKMRFGLTSALLNDGYFSYEMNTEGHGSLCLMWFDEYDNAGAGRGYLGYPLREAERLISSLETPNQVTANAFETGNEVSVWQVSSKEENAASAYLDISDPAEGNASVRIDSTQTPGDVWNSTFSYAPVSLIQDKEYTISFYARAEIPRTINVWVEQDSEPWDGLLNWGEFHLTKEWQKFEMPTTSGGNDPQARLVFGLGGDAGSVWLDEISFQEGNANIWRRDYDHGIVIVNATSETATVPLESTYVKINGSQAPTINDGSQTEVVSIPPFDGIILLRK